MLRSRAGGGSREAAEEGERGGATWERDRWKTWAPRERLEGGREERGRKKGREDREREEKRRQRVKESMHRD